MADNRFNLQINISADLGNTSVAFKSLQGQIQQAFAGVHASIKGGSTTVTDSLAATSAGAGAQAGAVVRANKTIQDSNETMGQKITSGLSKMTVAYGYVGMAIAAVASIIGGGSWLSGLITKQEQANESVYKLSQSLNITVFQASLYKDALQDIGLETDVLVRASRLLSRQIASDSTVFKQYGISLKDNEGNFKTTDEVMFDVIKKFKELGNTMATNTFGGKVFSRSFNEVRGVMRLTADSLEYAKQRAMEFGLVVTDSQLEATRKYRLTQEDANDVMDEFYKGIAFRLMPVMKDFLRGIEANREALSMLAGLLEVIIITLVLVGKAFLNCFYFVEFVIKSLIDLINRGGLFIANQLTFYFRMVTQGFTEAYAQFAVAESARISDSNAKLERYFNSWTKKTQDQVESVKIMYREMVEAEKLLADRSPGTKPPQSPDPRLAEAQMKELMRALALAEQQITRNTIGNADERNSQLLKLYQEYISTSIQQVQFEGELREQATANLQSKITAILDTNNQKQFAQYEENAKAITETSERELSERERQIQRQFELGEITDKQRLASLQAMLSEREGIYQVHYMMLSFLALGDKEKIDRIDKESLKKFADLLKQRRLLVELDSDKLKKINQKMANDFVGAFESGFKGVLSGSQSFTEAMRNVWSGLLNIVDEIIWSMVRAWILGEEAKTAASIFGMEFLATMYAIFTDLLIALSWKKAGNDVAVATTSGTASIWEKFAAMPPVAIALTAGLIGILGGLAVSARGGWDSVPFDGAMASLHKGEMVLPQNLAEKVRNMTESPQPSQNITYNITAMDAQSFKSFASKNKSILFNTHNSALRDGLQYGVRGV